MAGRNTAVERFLRRMRQGRLEACLRFAGASAAAQDSQDWAGQGVEGLLALAGWLPRLCIHQGVSHAAEAGIQFLPLVRFLSFSLEGLWRVREVLYLSFSLEGCWSSILLLVWNGRFI